MLEHAYNLLLEDTACGSGCTPIIMLFGRGREMFRPYSFVVDLVTRRKRDDNIQPRIFSVQDGGWVGDDSLFRQLACMTGGVWRGISGTSDTSYAAIVEAATMYQFDLAHKALSPGEVFKTWTGPYEDDFGLGEVVTASGMLLCIPLRCFRTDCR